MKTIHYTVQTTIVVEYIDDKGASSKSTSLISSKFKKNTVSLQEDDVETNDNTNKDVIKTILSQHTKKKILYENNVWIKRSYQKRHLKEIFTICPGLSEIKNIYKIKNAKLKSNIQS